MTHWQKAIKYCAIAFAIFLTVGIISGILGVIGAFGFLFDENPKSQELTVYNISGEITELEIEVGAADLKILTSDSFRVESNLAKLTVKESGKKLIIKQQDEFFKIRSENVKLELYIPTDTAFEKVNIITGAGALNIDAVCSDVLKLELGAGKSEIGLLTVTENADIDGGAGKLTIKGGELKDLDLDMGVGEITLTSRLLGASDLDFGIGNAKLTLIGNKEDYEIEIDKGLGNISVDGESAKDGQTYGGGNSKIDIDCGVGNVEMDFTE